MIGRVATLRQEIPGAQRLGAASQGAEVTVAERLQTPDGWSRPRLHDGGFRRGALVETGCVDRRTPADGRLRLPGGAALELVLRELRGVQPLPNVVAREHCGDGPNPDCAFVRHFPTVLAMAARPETRAIAGAVNEIGGLQITDGQLDRARAVIVMAQGELSEMVHPGPVKQWVARRDGLSERLPEARHSPKEFTIAANGDLVPRDGVIPTGSAYVDTTAAYVAAGRRHDLSGVNAGVALMFSAATATAVANMTEVPVRVVGQGEQALFR